MVRRPPQVGVVLLARLYHEGGGGGGMTSGAVGQVFKKPLPGFRQKQSDCVLTLCVPIYNIIISCASIMPSFYVEMDCSCQAMGGAVLVSDNNK